jgi:hypothetical protein
MKKQPIKPNTDLALSRLKDFQIKTVDYVFRQMFECGARRFLIADEVGLGKTLVARGVVARTIDYLWNKIERLRRIDVIYICSNGDIARQNINRLNVFDSDDEDENEQYHDFASRLTLLPLHIREIDDKPLNFIALTPGTSFNKRSSGGIARERIMIYHMLREAWGFGSEKAPMNILQYGVENFKQWRKDLKKFDYGEIDAGVKKAFLKDLNTHSDLRVRFNSLKDRFIRARKPGRRPGHEDRDLQRNFISDIRRTLAKTCVKKLEPDLIILDEFQRFKNLLEGEDEAAKLANTLFNYKDAFVLLLSATPFKPFTFYGESETDNHYKDFLKTLEFLFDSPEEYEATKRDLARLGENLYHIGRKSNSELIKAKAEVESRLRRVMVRTERLSIEADRNGMLVEVLNQVNNLFPGDLMNFSLLDSVAQTLEVGDPLEYWKSAPYILNTMDRSGYVIKKQFLNAANDEHEFHSQLLRVLSSGGKGLLQWNKVESYQKVDPANARLRDLLGLTIDPGAWQLLWVPPSLPYYRINSGPFAKAKLQDFSKVLVFSAWKIVPKVIAMLTSYEAERQMFANSREPIDPSVKNYSKEYSKKSRPLAFSIIDERPERMNNLVLFYPCLTLARQIDPLLISLNLIKDGKLPNAHQVMVAVENQIREILEPIIPKRSKGGRKDLSWYWAALALLDRKYNYRRTNAWLEAFDEKLSWKTMVHNNYADYFYQMFKSPQELGDPPDDIYETLAKAALGSPAVVTLRSFLRIIDTDSIDDLWPAVLAASAKVASGFQTLFNLPNVTALLRSLHTLEESRYWETILNYCVNGNLQSVIDEYIHVLVESLGLMDKPPDIVVKDLAKEMHDAISIQTVNLELDEIKPNRSLGRIDYYPRSMRCRFALRFGDKYGVASEVEKTLTRKEQVRQAFNSPFWPFVLSSTSIGQEGLDFHQYCHNVFHWNLPNNPVDLEQREGRVHRYKGHAIRLNIAQRYPLRTLAGKTNGLGDPWALLFQSAQNDAREAGNPDDLVPFWIFPEGNYKICRHVPMFPFSKDVERYETLKNNLVTYRMVLGQPRQEDLVNFLQQRFEEGFNSDEFLKFRIDLTPR